MHSSPRKLCCSKSHEIPALLCYEIDFYMIYQESGVEARRSVCPINGPSDRAWMNHEEPMKKNLTIGVAGAGGDGVVTMGLFLQRIAAAEGYFSQMARYYGAQIRGGGSAVKLELDAEAASLPRDNLDIMVCFDWDKYLEVRQELSLGPDTLVLYEKDPRGAIELPQRAFRMGLAEKSQEATGATRNKNLVALGLTLGILGFLEARVREIVETDERLSLLRDRWPALSAGMAMKAEFSSDLTLSPPKDKAPKSILHGSAAMARAAVRAGCRVYFGYPITPAAEIMQEMKKGLSCASCVFLQAEDEVASAGLLVGASLAGAKSMTATSGPGLDRMTEMLGLAVASEIPLVIVDVQRCGPSTGIPSKSEQSDLNHAIYGGHGDAPRVVIAPHSVEGCYRLTIESFNIAEHFQVPVILLSDQWLAQTLVATKGDFLEGDYALVGRKRPVPVAGGAYHRYQPTEDFISPMSDAGDTGLMYQTSGLTHNEGGAPALDAETHQRLHDKRWMKLSSLCRRDDLVTIFGDERSRKGIITWGSSTQVIRDTVNFLGLEGVIKGCVPELIHPLPESVEAFVRSVEQLLVVEMNHSGQLFRYLRSQIDLPRQAKVYCRPGGRPFSRRELSQPLQELAE